MSKSYILIIRKWYGLKVYRNHLTDLCVLFNTPGLTEKSHMCNRIGHMNGIKTMLQRGYGVLQRPEYNMGQYTLYYFLFIYIIFQKIAVILYAKKV